MFCCRSGFNFLFVSSAHHVADQSSGRQSGGLFFYPQAASGVSQQHLEKQYPTGLAIWFCQRFMRCRRDGAVVFSLVCFRYCRTYDQESNSVSRHDPDYHPRHFASWLPDLPFQHKFTLGKSELEPEAIHSLCLHLAIFTVPYTTLIPIYGKMLMKILHNDKQIIVLVKPVGMDAEHDVPAALGCTVFPIHRLDKNVGGVMVYAKTKAAAAALSKAIQEGNMIKEYVARVHGTPPQQGDWEDLLFKDSSKNKVFVVKKERKGVKKARLEYRLLSGGVTSLVRIRLHTGRSHQIRVQFSSRGFALVGDHKYGARDDIPTPMLFSCCIRFPFGGKDWCFEAYPEWAET